MAKPFLLIGNFKMNPGTRMEVEQYMTVLRREAEGKQWSQVEGVICPPFLYLPLCTDLPKGFVLGAQDVFPEKTGAFTGEVSVTQLKDMGVQFVIVGHSERRQYFGETNASVRIRTEAVLKYVMQPVVCIGETGEQRQSRQTEQVLGEQLQSIFEGCSKMQAERIIIAYEPCWAIGTGVTPTTAEIQEIGEYIRHTVRRIAGAEIRVLYGGSVKERNLAGVSWQAGMDGVLIGGESLFPFEMVKMMDRTETKK